MAIYQDDQGNWWAKLELDWDDGTELDLKGYIVEIKRSGEDKWQAQAVTESEAVFDKLALGVSYYARVKAVDNAGNASAYVNFNAGALIAMPADVVAPATPANLTVTAAKKSIRIKVDKNTEGDWAGNEFHVSTSNGFTPGAGTLVHSGKTTAHTYQTASYAVRYVRVRSYDTASSPNYSAYTAQGSATPGKVGGGGGSGFDDIEDASIQNAQIISLIATKITAGTLAAGVIYVGEVAAEKITAGTLDVTVLLQAASIKAGTITADVNISGPGDINIGGFLTVGGLITGNNNINLAGDYKIAGISVIDSSRNLINVQIDGNTVTGDSVKVVGLNSDLIDGYHASPANTASYAVVRDANKDIQVDSIWCSGFTSMIDGMAAPGATVGFAKLYVDSANGDLYIKFGDGTTKLIMVD